MQVTKLCHLIQNLYCDQVAIENCLSVAGLACVNVNRHRTRSSVQLDGCIVWNEHITVFSSKAICTQAVYFLHTTMPSVTCLRLSDVTVICRVTYLQFPIKACIFSMSVSQAAQRRSWFTQYRTSEIAENFGR